MTEMTINPDNWIRVTTAAKELGIKRQAIYYHLKSGNLERLEIDGVSFVRRTDIHNLKSRPQARH